MIRSFARADILGDDGKVDATCITPRLSPCLRPTTDLGKMAASAHPSIFSSVPPDIPEKSVFSARGSAFCLESVVAAVAVVEKVALERL
jgi:hypothetical protein